MKMKRASLLLLYSFDYGDETFIKKNHHHSSISIYDFYKKN